MRQHFIAASAVVAALALGAPLPAAGQARPREGSSAPSSGSSGSSGSSERVSSGSSGSGAQAAPRVGSSRSGSSRSGRGGGTSVRERSVPSSGVRAPSGSRARPRGESGVLAGTGSPGAAGAYTRARSGVATGRAVPRSSRPPIVRPPNRWYYPGWSPISYYSPWLYGTYGLGHYFYDPWWLVWGPAYGSYGYGYDTFYDAYGYGYGYGGGGGSYGGSSRTVSDYGQVRLKVKPSDAEVFVDGTRKGDVSDFDGVWERLEVPFGTHVIEIRREGYQPRAWDVTLQSKDLVTIQGELSEK